MSLKSGQYHITTADGGFPIGRRLYEDKTLKPKGIFKLPKGTKSVWDVEKLANGNYILKTGGAIVGGVDGHVYAFLVPGEATDPVVTEWKFIFDERRKNDGEPYLIAAAPSDRHDGWVVPESSDVDPYPQLIMRVLIEGPSLPPFYPPNQVYFFKKVDA